MVTGHLQLGSAQGLDAVGLPVSYFSVAPICLLHSFCLAFRFLWVGCFRHPGYLVDVHSTYFFPVCLSMEIFNQEQHWWSCRLYLCVLPPSITLVCTLVLHFSFFKLFFLGDPYADRFLLNLGAGDLLCRGTWVWLI